MNKEQEEKIENRLSWCWLGVFAFVLTWSLNFSMMFLPWETIPDSEWTVHGEMGKTVISGGRLDDYEMFKIEYQGNIYDVTAKRGEKSGYHQGIRPKLLKRGTTVITHKLYKLYHLYCYITAFFLPFAIIGIIFNHHPSPKYNRNPAQQKRFKPRQRLLKKKNRR